MIFVRRGGLPLAVALACLIVPTYAAAAPSGRSILIKDECNPATFNVAVGPGTCTGNGAVTFGQFINELQKLQRAPQWQFVPGQSQMVVGESFTATNVGGETHTFTEVDHFGGGVVPVLNALSGAGAPIPECSNGTINSTTGNFNFAAPALASLVPPGGSFTDTETADDVGHPVLYQCCIHPWMHEVITVRPRPALT